MLVTGGAGFVGSDFVRTTVERRDADVTVLDALTYASDRRNLAPVEGRFTFVEGDVADEAVVEPLVAQADVVVHFAAESHVDTSIVDPATFVRTNVVGTLTLLQAVRRWGVRYHHVSTDEVFGDLPLDAEAPAFTASSPYRPSSPYAASKAASDHLVRAWVRTYGIAATLSASSNVYGPYQHPEKLIPHTITTALDGGRPRVYGSGRQVRDWVHVADHTSALWAILERGTPGETYLVGAENRYENRWVVETLLALAGRAPHEYDLVADRPGHDLRYAVDPSRLRDELGWRPRVTDFRDGLRATVEWYRANEAWWRPKRATAEARYAALGR